MSRSQSRSKANGGVASMERASTTKYLAKRELIVAAGSDVINHQGVKGMTLAKVAETVGLSTTSVTYYFKRKDDLAAACIARGIEQLNALVVEASQQHSPAASVRRFVQLYLEHRAAIRRGECPPLCVFNDARALSRDVVGPLRKAFDRLLANLRLMLSDSNGSTKRERSLIARAHLFFFFVGWLPLWVTRYDPEDYGRVAERFADVVLNGLAASTSTLPTLTTTLRAEVRREADQKEMFLIAATHLINEQGYHGASVDKISARLNVTKGSFYHHVDNKDDLVAMCFARTFSIVGAIQREAMSLKVSGWEQLITACTRLLEFQLSDVGPLLNFSAFTALPPEMIEQTVHQADGIPLRFAEILNSGIADGSIRPVDTFIAANMLTAMISSLTEVHQTIPDIDLPEAMEIIAKPLFVGLLNA
jgi:AcrR family transcriptional regulator